MNSGIPSQLKSFDDRFKVPLSYLIDSCSNGLLGLAPSSAQIQGDSHETHAQGSACIHLVHPIGSFVRPHEQIHSSNSLPSHRRGLCNFPCNINSYARRAGERATFLTQSSGANHGIGVFMDKLCISGRKIHIRQNTTLILRRSIYTPFYVGSPLCDGRASRIFFI